MRTDPFGAQSSAIATRRGGGAVPLRPGDYDAPYASHWMQRAAIAVLVAALCLALVNLVTELRVAAMRTALDAQQSEAEVAWPWLIDDRPAAMLAPRTALLRGMLRTYDALDEPAPRRAAMLADAAVDLARTRGVRTWWAEADVAQSYRALLADGPDSPAALAGLVRSYESAPFLRGAAPWRIRYGAALWAKLSAADHARIVDETVWLAGASGRTYGYATGLVAGTPAEAPVAARLAETAR